MTIQIAVVHRCHYLRYSDPMVVMCVHCVVENQTTNYSHLAVGIVAIAPILYSRPDQQTIDALQLNPTSRPANGNEVKNMSMRRMLFLESVALTLTNGTNI